MQEDPLKRSSVKNITKTLVAFKAARLSLGVGGGSKKNQKRRFGSLMGQV